MRNAINIVVGVFVTLGLYSLYVADNLITIFGIGTRVKFKTFCKGYIYASNAAMRITLALLIMLIIWLLT